MESTTKILIVEHNASDLQYIQNELKRSELDYVSAVVDTEDDFTRSLENFIPHLILAEYALPRFSGLKAFKLKQELAPNAAFIMMSQSMRKDKSSELMNIGIKDFISKDNLVSLPSKVKNALHEAREQQATRPDPQQLEVIYNTVQDIIFMLEVDVQERFKFTSANQAFLEFTSLAPEQVMGKSVEAVLPAAFLKQSLVMYRRVLYTCLPAEWEQNGGDGHPTLHIRVTPIVDHLGNCSNMVVTAQDITRQKQLMRSLEQSNQRNEYVSKATFDAILDWDMITGKLHRGEGYNQLFGKVEEDDAGIESLFERVHPEDRDKLLSVGKAFMKSNENNRQHEHRYLKSNGAYANVTTKVLVIRNAHGWPVRAIAAMHDITQEKSLQATLDTAIKVARFGTWELDLVHNTLHWSDMIRDIAETAPDYQPALDTGLLLYKEGFSRDLITQKLTEATEQGLSFDIEAILVTTAGADKWIRILGTPEFENGACVRVTGSVQDIDARKRAELKANKILEERNNILESIADAFFAIDKNWITSYWNNQAVKIFSKQKEEVLGRSIWDIFPDRVGSKAYIEYHKALEGPKVSRFEDYNPTLDKWFSIDCYPSDNGGLSVYVKEITARKQSELQLQQLNIHLKRQAAELELYNKELKESEKRFSDIFSMSPQPMFLFDIDTLRFGQVNEAATRLYGYSAEEFKQMRITDIKVEEQKHSPEENAFAPENAGLLYHQVHKHRKKTGEIIDVEIYSNFITVNGKRLRSVIAIDVTEKNQQEYKLLKAIIKTQEDERYEIGGELHDNVCQILAGSQLFLGMLESDLSPEKKVYYMHCMDNIQLALGETRDLSHRLAPAFLAESTLEDAFRKMLRSFMLSSSMQIKLDFDERLAEHDISLEAQLNLYRILQEQLRNIVKYASASEVLVAISIHDSNLVMTINDNGIGFDTSKGKNGIGLANMKRRAELFSGQFLITSSPGHGCTVEVSVPLSEIMFKEKTQSPG